MASRKIQGGAAVPVAITVDGGQNQNVAITGQPIKIVQDTTTEASSSLFSAFGEQKVVQKTLVAGLLFVYNINSNLATTTVTGSGTVTHDDVFAVLSTTTNTSSSAELSSRKIIEYRPGEGIEVLFTALFTSGVAGSTQIIGAGDDEDGLFFGYNGTDFGVLRRSGGSDNWVVQSAWSVDKADGTGELPVLDPTKGNVYKIQYQWLGFGGIEFFIENPATKEFDLVHRVEYPNSQTVTTMKNPSTHLYAFSENTTNNTNIVLKTGSMAGYVQGGIEAVGYIYSISNVKTGIDATPTNIITIRNKATYQSKTNKISIQLYFASLASDGNKNLRMQFIVNTTLGGVPSYTDIDTNNSVVDYDTAGTTVSGGRVVANVFLGKVEGKEINIRDYDFDLLPGETFTVAANTTSAGANEADVSLTWLESL